MPGLFDQYIIDTPSAEEVLQKKVPKKKKITSSKSLSSKSISIEDKLSFIDNEVKRVLGTYGDTTEVIRDYTRFVSYIDYAISTGIIAVDTETNNSLDPLTCKLMGLCLYVPGESHAYIPVNHTDLEGNLLPNQISESQIKEQLDRLTTTTILMHNGSFDYRVIKCTCNCTLHIDWDTMIAARLLNENEPAGLKPQYITKIDPSIEKYDIENLFTIPYKYVSPEIFALYAATDAYMTYRLYMYQKAAFEVAENNKLYNLFKTVEMPMVIVCADMELTGVCLDLDYSKRLSAKYHKLADDLTIKINAELHKYDDKIASWRNSPEANEHPIDSTGKVQKSKSEKLESPVNLSSNTQLSILLYDVLKLLPIYNSSSKGDTKSTTVREEALKKLSTDYDIPLLNLILEQRGLDKLISTYIDKLPECINPATNRVHPGYLQIGADTGRMSSNNPNIQNIPSHNPEIRMMFTASPGYIMLGSDFSAQEPRLFTAYCKDPKMKQNYLDKRDLYSTVATMVYNNNYEDNLEFNHDGTQNKDGKARRSSCKSIILGIMYGRGVASIADQIKGHDGPTTKEDVQRAQDILDTFFTNFPKAKEWIDKTHEDAKRDGYVEDLWGRRRRLPDIQLAPYVCEQKGVSTTFNPLIGSNGTYLTAKTKDEMSKLVTELTNAKTYKERKDIEAKANKMGYTVKNNSGFISQAERQCVNARVQGGAATITKKALILLHDNEELKSLGFRILFPVHDEIICECPIEHQDRCKELLSELMIQSALPECDIPMSCDAEVFTSWYIDVYETFVSKEFNKLLDTGLSKEDAIIAVWKNHEECTLEQLTNLLN